MYNIRYQPLNDEDTNVEIVDDLPLADALMLARNRAIESGRAVDIYDDDQYHLTVGDGL